MARPAARTGWDIAEVGLAATAFVVLCVLALRAVPYLPEPDDSAYRASIVAMSGGHFFTLSQAQAHALAVQLAAQLGGDIGPAGLTFNQYLIDDEQPLLFHTGHRATFPLLAEAIAAITPPGRLRWITFGRVEADECGAVNQLLAAAPQAEVAHGALGCMVSLNDLADRPPVPLADGQVLQLGAHRVRHIDTPHVPHGWEARVLYEETTSTLLCGDLFTQLGNGPAITTGDIIGAAAQAEDAFRASCLTPDTGPTIRRLADLNPATLAVMHGSCFTGDGPAALLALAADYDQRLCSRHEPLITPPPSSMAS